MEDGYREPGTGQLMAEGSNSQKGEAQKEKRGKEMLRSRERRTEGT